MSETLKILVPLTVEEFNTLDLLATLARTREHTKIGSRVARLRQKLAASRPPGYAAMIRELNRETA